MGREGKASLPPGSDCSLVRQRLTWWLSPASCLGSCQRWAAGFLQHGHSRVPAFWPSTSRKPSPKEEALFCPVFATRLILVSIPKSCGLWEARPTKKFNKVISNSATSFYFSSGATCYCWPFFKSFLACSSPEGLSGFQALCSICKARTSTTNMLPHVLFIIHKPPGFQCHSELAQFFIWLFSTLQRGTYSVRGDFLNTCTHTYIRNKVISISCMSKSNSLEKNIW